MKIEMTVEELKELLNVTKKTDDDGNRFEFESSVDCMGLTLEKAVEGIKKIDLPHNSNVKVRYSSIL